jgi:uncharacterized protein YdiU (UPF0061 family)
MSTTTAPTFELDDDFARELPGLSVKWQPSPASDPKLLALNDGLAAELGLDPEMLRSPEGVTVLAGNDVPINATPVAMAYAGHQFGGYAPQLGDGRALLLGEVVDINGTRRDLHLKGSGRTPFARGADGKAAVGPMLREFLIAEAMHALDVPTARALAVVATGDQVAREGLLPGAVLTRVAASHIRIGTFEYAARLEDQTVLPRLADYSIARHHRAAADSDEPYLAFLQTVVDVQAALVARWMLVGFVHGVMNTDNTTISGETIDYGPCAFLDHYDPAAVFSSIDQQGRYAYGNQAYIMRWNLIRLAETLVPFIDEDSEAAVAAATDVLGTFRERFAAAWADGMRAKLGLAEPRDVDEALLDGLIELFQAHRVDYTSSFRMLAASLRNDESARSPFVDDAASRTWTQLWRDRLDAEGREPQAVASAMDAANPIYIPRNHLVEAALHAATEGDIAPFEKLLEMVTSPFTARDGEERFAEQAPETFNESFKTFCGT